jgi:cytochrome c biogenesis protein CcmG/thiol:disulfide interchange protein DsbE
MFWRSWVFEKFCCSTTGLNDPSATGALTDKSPTANTAALHRRFPDMTLLPRTPISGRDSMTSLRRALKREPDSRVLLLAQMRRFLVPGLVVGVAAAVLALLAFGVSNQGTSTSIDTEVAHGHLPPAPDAHTALPVLGSPNSTESLAHLRGKVVVLNVFASWCDPCKAEAPILEQAQRKLVKNGGTILGVTYLDNSSDSEQFVRQWHITYPVVRDVDGSFVRSFGTTGVPETFVINRQGRIAALRRFQLDDQWLSHTLPSILAKRS